MASLLPTLPPLCTTSQQIYHEATPIYLRTTRAEILIPSAAPESALFMAKWLSSFGLDAWRAVCRLHVTGFSESNAAAVHGVIARCVLLRRPRVWWLSTPGLACDVAVLDRERCLELDALLAGHQLARFLELEMLERLEVRLPDVGSCSGKQGLAYQLRAWFGNHAAAKDLEVGVGFEGDEESEDETCPGRGRNFVCTLGDDSSSDSDMD